MRFPTAWLPAQMPAPPLLAATLTVSAIGLALPYTPVRNGMQPWDASISCLSSPAAASVGLCFLVSFMLPANTFLLCCL